MDDSTNSRNISTSIYSQDRKSENPIKITMQIWRNTIPIQRVAHFQDVTLSEVIYLFFLFLQPFLCQLLCFHFKGQTALLARNHVIQVVRTDPSTNSTLFSSLDLLYTLFSNKM